MAAKVGTDSQRCALMSEPTPEHQVVTQKLEVIALQPDLKSLPYFAALVTGLLLPFIQHGFHSKSFHQNADNWVMWVVSATVVPLVLWFVYMLVMWWGHIKEAVGEAIGNGLGPDDETYLRKGFQVPVPNAIQWMICWGFGLGTAAVVILVTTH